MPQPEQLPACFGFLHSPFDPADPEPSPTVHSAVLRVRDFLQRLLEDESRGAGVSDADLEQLDRALARAGQSRGIVPTVRGYGWGWRRDPGEVTRRTFPALWSAGKLLTSDDRHRLKRCDGCGQLFLDRSRNRSRRWCVMEGCGNRAKVRRFRQRVGS